MARNTGTGGRLGPINNRTQAYNSKTGQYVKRGDDGKFIAAKETPYKNVRREQSAKEHETEKSTTKNK